MSTKNATVKIYTLVEEVLSTQREFNGSMIVFLQALLQFWAVRFRRRSEFSRSDFLWLAVSEMVRLFYQIRTYFQNK